MSTLAVSASLSQNNQSVSEFNRCASCHELEKISIVLNLGLDLHHKPTNFATPFNNLL